MAFVLLAGVAGTLYAMTMPPLQVADEKTHLFRAFGVSRGSCVATERTSIPRSLLRLEATFPPVLEKRRLVTQGEVWRWRTVPLRAERTSEVTAAAANVYGCAPYLAAAAGIRAATDLDLSPLWVLYAGRLANLAAYIFLVALALAILADFRPILLALALMPMTLHQAASLSADSLTIATAFLATAIAMRCAVRSDRAAHPGSAGLAVSSVLAIAALCKTNVALATLAGLLPRASSRGALRHAAAVAAVAAPATGAAILWAWVNWENIELFRAAQKAARGVDMAVNAGVALARPISFLASVAQTSAHQATSQLEQLIGVFGWATVRRPAWTTWLYGGVLLAAPLLGARSVSLRAAQRAVLAVTAALGVLSVFWSLWTISTNVAGADLPLHGAQIGGLAGRYFIPFALPALLSVSSGRWRRAERMFGAAVLCVTALVNAVSLGEIGRHYYTSDGLMADTAVFDLAAQRVVQLVPGTRVEQTLRPRFNRLARIDVDVATYGRRIPSGTLRARLRSADGQVLVVVDLPLRDVEDGSYVSLAFAPLAASKRVELRLELALEDLPPGYSLGLYATGEGREAYPAGALSVDGAATTGDLQFRAYRSRPIGRA